jgi:hypothetical protein
MCSRSLRTGCAKPSSSRYIKGKNALIAPMSSCTGASDVGGPKSV